MEKEEILEPCGWDFNKDGLWLGWVKPNPNQKNCIDKALVALYGKESHKPTGATRWDFKKK